MRLTTKIIVGIISFIFLFSLIFIIGFSFSDRTEKRNFNVDQGSISRENKKEIELDFFKTVLIDYLNDTDGHNILPKGTISIRPLSGNEKNKLIVSEEMNSYLTLNISNDTLIILFDRKKLYEKYRLDKEYPQYKYIHTSIEGAEMTLQSNYVDIISNLNQLEIEVKNIKTNHIKVNAFATIIDSCEAISVSPYNQQRFILKNSKVEELNIDLDFISNWSVEKCELTRKNITGSGKKSTNLNKYESMELNWLPKDRKATLNLTLYGDTSRIVVKN